MKKCIFCAEEIQKEAKVCKHCGKEQKKKLGCGGIILLVICAIIILSSLGTLIGDSTSTNNNSKSSELTNVPDENWIMNEWNDEMTDNLVRTMSVISSNTIYFDFPYNGGSKAQLIIRNNAGEKDVLVIVDPSQISSDYNNPTVLVRFDDKQAQTFSYAEPADYSNDKIFIKDTGTFIENLKNAQKVMIEIGFYQEGQKTFEFNTQGFNYDELIK